MTVLNRTGALAGATGHGVAMTGGGVQPGDKAYWMQLQVHAPASLIKVSTVDSNGAAITGYYTTLWQSGQLVGTCFSPCSFGVSNGLSYQVSVSNYGVEAFSHWQDGSTTRLYTVNVPSTSTTISLTASYTP